jgi:hypothetical protein
MNLNQETTDLWLILSCFVSLVFLCAKFHLCQGQTHGLYHQALFPKSRPSQAWLAGAAKCPYPTAAPHTLGSSCHAQSCDCYRVCAHHAMFKTRNEMQERNVPLMAPSAVTRPCFQILRVKILIHNDPVCSSRSDSYFLRLKKKKTEWNRFVQIITQTRRSESKRDSALPGGPDPVLGKMPGT